MILKVAAIAINTTLTLGKVGKMSKVKVAAVQLKKPEIERP